MIESLKSRKGIILLDGIIAIALLSMLLGFVFPNLLYSQKTETYNEQTTKAVFIAEQKRAEIEVLKYDDVKSETKTDVGNGFSTEVVVSVGSQEEKKSVINVYHSSSATPVISLIHVIFKEKVPDVVVPPEDYTQVCNPTFAKMYVMGIWTTLTTDSTYTGTPCAVFDGSATADSSGTVWYTYGGPPAGGHWFKMDFGSKPQFLSQITLQGLKITDWVASSTLGKVVFYGSNDDVTYTQIGSGTGENNYKAQGFNVNPALPYRFYRINVLSASPYCSSGKCAGFQEIYLTKASATVKNYGSYRAWSDGTYASSAQEYRTGDSSRNYSGDVGDGIYRIKNAYGQLQDVYADMTTDGGGWMLVASSWQDTYATTMASTQPDMYALGRFVLPNDFYSNYTQFWLQGVSPTKTINRIRTFSATKNYLSQISEAATETYLTEDNVRRPSTMTQYGGFAELHRFGVDYASRYIIRPSQVHVANAYENVGINDTLGQWARMWVR